MVFKTDIQVTETLMAHKCGTCGIWYGMTEGFYNQRLKDGESFYCPNGHPRMFTQKAELEKQLTLVMNDLEKERKVRANAQEALGAALADHNRTKQELRRERTTLTKLKNRVGNGVCPCCNRSFVNLQRHIHGQHPDFKTEA